MGKRVAIFKDSNEAVIDSIELKKITWSTKSDDEDIQTFQEINSVLDGFKERKGNANGFSLSMFPAKTEIALDTHTLFQSMLRKIFNTDSVVR